MAGARVALKTTSRSERSTRDDDERGFDDAFPGEADGPSLDELRTTFAASRSSPAKSTRSVRRPLAARARATRRVPPEFEPYLDRRAELGLGLPPEAAVPGDGQTGVPGGGRDRHLRFARTIRVSIEGNAGLCRGLLATRYGKEVAA